MYNQEGVQEFALLEQQLQEKVDAIQNLCPKNLNNPEGLSNLCIRLSRWETFHYIQPKLYDKPEVQPLDKDTCVWDDEVAIEEVEDWISNRLVEKWTKAIPKANL